MAAWRIRCATIAAALLIVAPIRHRVALAQDASSLSGEWTIDRGRSEFPSEIGFAASFMPDTPVPDSSANSRGRGRSGRTNPVYTRPDSADDAARIEQLTSAVRTPPINVTIEDGGSSVTITADGLARTFHPNGKDESIKLDKVPVSTVTTRVGANIVVVYHAAEGRDLRYTFWRSAAPPQLVVDAAFVERGATDSIRRVYVPGTAAPPPPPPPNTTAAGAPSGGSSPAGALPPVAQGPDAELRGITRLGLSVEGLSKQAAGCGLTQEAIEAAVSKEIAGAGFTVVREVTSDNDPYLYVNVMTTATASGLCVSRFDVSLFTHTTARLSYQPAQALVQVQLAHAGSLAGGDSKTHADTVIHGVTGYVDDIAARIRAAGK